VSQIEKVLAKLANDRELLERLRQQGMRYARECLSWDWKAQVTSQILAWAVGQGPKPDLQPPQDTVAKTVISPLTGTQAGSIFAHSTGLATPHLQTKS
jgi:hypothetical protein